MKHIKRVDGFYGCYRGLTPKLVGSIIGVIGSKRVADKLGLDEAEENESKDDSDITEEERYSFGFHFTETSIGASEWRGFYSIYSYLQL